MLSMHLSQEELPLVARHTGTSLASTVTNLTCVMIGAGVLAFPKLFARVGVTAGTSLLIFCGTVSVYLCGILGDAIGIAQQRTGLQFRKMDDLGQACFGKVGSLAARVVVNAMFIGKIGCYIVLVGQNLNYLSNVLPYRAWVLVVSAILLPVSSISDVTLMAKASIVGVLASVLYFVTILGGAWKAHGDRGGPLPWEPELGPHLPTMLSVLTTMMFGFGPADVLTTVRNDMAKPAELWHALIYSHVGTGFIYLSVGVLGFIGFGEPNGNIGLSMCDWPGCPGVAGLTRSTAGAKWIWGYVLSGAVVANLVVTIPIILYCLFTGVESMWPEDAPMGGVQKVIMRFGTVLFCCVVGLFTPYFSEVLAILSAALVVPLVFFLPLVFSWKAALDAGQAHGLLRNVLHSLVFAVGIVCLVIGFSEAVRDLQTAIAEDSSAGNALANFWA